METACFEQERFRLACSRFATGVAIATVMRDQETPAGITISSFTSVSLEPPLVLFCIHSGSRVLPHFRARGRFGINVLSADQLHLSSHFTRSDARFDLLEWEMGTTGVPVIAGALAVLECELREGISRGDHEILMGEVVSTAAADGPPLVRYGRAYRTLAAVP
jgi:flavin reductase (DIM6/NTAB) family NADH-FMN oxidoreductase RutF